MLPTRPIGRGTPRGTRPLELRRALPLLGLASILAGVSPVQAGENPFDEAQRDLARQVLRAGSDPQGLVPLLTLWNRWERATPEVTRRELERLASHTRLPPARRAYARALLARAQLRMGEVEASNRTIQELGYVTAWRIAGPFDNEGKSGFETEMPPEAMRLDPVDPDAHWPGKERPVGWQSWPALTRYGYVAFDTVLRPRHNACAFAETFVTSERDQPLTLWAGAGGAVTMWWNGDEVLRDRAYRRPDPDRHVAMVGARSGPNRLLVKVCNTDPPWGFFLRVGDRSGGPPSGVDADPQGSHQVERGHADLALPAPPTAPLQALEASAARDRPRAADLEALARFLSATGADDEAEHRARQLAARAAKLEPTVPRLRLAASLAEQRGDVMRFVERARELAPDDPRVLLMRAQVARSGAMPEEALPLLARISGNTLEAMEARLLRAEVLRELELPESSLAELEQLQENAAGAPYWTRQLAEAAQAAGRADLAIQMRREVVAQRHDDIGSRRMLVADALARDEPEDVLEQMAVLSDLATTTRELGYLARTHEALGRDADALEALRRARELAPDDAGVLVAEGRLLLRRDQAEPAADALQQALALRPQDAQTRELLEQVGSRKRTRRDEQYIVPVEELMARRTEGNGYGATVLEDLTVNTVYDNGLGSNLRQLAVQIHDEEGARAWRTYSVQYDPNVQRVQIRQARILRGGRSLEASRTFERQLGEPWYRIYYDTRAFVIVFPTVQPGDVVEVRYRVDDVARRNMFADYYGDLQFLRDFIPVRRLDYVLITPSSRALYFNEPDFRGLQHARTEGDGRRVDHFFATDVPAVHQEADMPGMTEVAPHLHVSTYRTWQEVGTWYWGLIRDQLYADQWLQDKVRELVTGAPDLRTKVERIHNWVVKNTRYVALEFGIHGYKPYRVPQIVRRGFGDCKDKASLMYTMFREAGIDAHVILVRTRRNGAIERMPASLAVFDHAIAYVPELDLYLDGTAEHSGTSELPPQDQGVTVLHVWPDGSELRRTPVMPASHNLHKRTMEMELERSGKARIDVREEVRGAEASGYRSTLEAGGTRAERFERKMRSVFPGLRLDSLEVENVSDLEAPVRFRYRAEVPQMGRDGGGALRLSSTVLDDLLRSMARTTTRRHPLDFGRTTAYEERRTVRLPAGARLGSAPESGRAESDFGSLELEVEGEGDRVEVRTRFELTRDRITPEEYPAFRSWIEKADALLRQRINIELAPGSDGR